MMMTQYFKKVIEDFVCENCGQQVVGKGFTNHCPFCLWSKHVDINPGDRAEGCGGLMEPRGIELKRGRYILIHQCLKCGRLWRNEASVGDQISEFLNKML